MDISCTNNNEIIKSLFKISSRSILKNKNKTSTIVTDENKNILSYFFNTQTIVMRFDKVIDKYGMYMNFL